MHNLHHLLEHELKDLYSAEKQLVEALPKAAEVAQDPELKAWFEKHRKETTIHAERLQQVAHLLWCNLGNMVCVGMQGLIAEAEKIIKNHEMNPDVKDAALIAGAQKIEHYEIAAYGTVATYADVLGLIDVWNILKKTLDEEKMTDEKLTRLAEKSINRQAKN